MANAAAQDDELSAARVYIVQKPARSGKENIQTGDRAGLSSGRFGFRIPKAEGSMGFIA